MSYVIPNGRTLARVIGRAHTLSVSHAPGMPIVARIAREIERAAPIGDRDPAWYAELTLDAQIRVLAGLGYALAAGPRAPDGGVQLVIVDQLAERRATLPRPWQYPVT